MDVILSKDAKKQYENLLRKDQVKILKKLSSLVTNPYAGKKLTGELKGLYSLRSWPYRILYEINSDEKRIEIHKIVHRQSVYS